MLTTLANVKIKLGIPAGNTSQDAILSALIEQADALLKSEMDQNIEVQEYVDFYSGEGTRFLIVKQRPILVVKNIWVDNNAGYGTGQEPFTTDPIQQGLDYSPRFDYTIRNTTIAITSVSNTTPIVVTAPNHLLHTGQYITVLNNAAASGYWKVTVIDGNTFSLDESTANGVASGGSAIYTVSRSGLVLRMRTVWPMIDRSYFPGRLSTEIGPPIGNIKVHYISGYPVIPPELTYACDMLVAWVLKQAPIGGIVQSEGIGAYNYSLWLQQGIQMLGDVSRVIRRYRELAV